MRYGADPSGIPTASPAHHARWIRGEAAMAVITFDTAHEAGGRFETVLTVLSETLDAFANGRMRLAGAQAEHARPRRLSQR
jgi:hypothetical protein